MCCSHAVAAELGADRGGVRRREGGVGGLNGQGRKGLSVATGIKGQGSKRRLQRSVVQVGGGARGL